MKLLGVVAGEWELKRGEDWKVYAERTSKMFDELEKTSDRLKDGEIVGALISFPIADGRAVYRIESEKPLAARLVPYGDAYQIDAAHMRGLRLSDVKELVRRDRAIRKLFGQEKMGL